MIKNLLFLLLLAIFALNTGYAQEGQPCPDPPPPGSTACQTSCVFCDFNGLMSDNYFPPSGGNSGCPSISLHNDAWYGFIAGTSQIDLDIITSNCVHGDGLQAAFWDDCSDGNALVCNGGCGGCGNIPVSLSYSGFTPGQTYWLMIDGWVADSCDYTIDVTNGSVSPPAPDPATQPQGPTQVCPGATVVYSIPEVNGAGYYHWTSPAGSTINGGPSNQFINAPEGAEVTITFGSAGGNVCVQVGNSCNPAGPNQCLPVTNMPIPPTVKPDIVICYEDAPFTWDEEPYNVLTNPGTFNLSSTPYDSYLGCDSVVKQKVVIKNSLQSTMPNQYICAGSCFDFAGDQYCDPGLNQVVLQSYQGCDSLVNFSIAILSPFAEIGGNMPITCNTPGGLTLSAQNYLPGSSFQWSNANWGIIGGAPTQNVNMTGTYHLVVTVNGGGQSCRDTAEVTVTGNTVPPGATATGTNINCISTTAQLMGNSPTMGVNFSWAGPGITPANKNLQNPVVNQQGTYTLTVSDPSNGCTSTATVNVLGDNTPPSVLATGGTITCTQSSVTIDGMTNAGSPVWNWSGPGINAGNQMLEDVVGTYNVTITNTVNGCTNTGTTTVDVNTTSPTVSAGPDQTLTCTLPNATLQGSGDTGGSPMSILWNGPNNFVDTVLNPTINVGGTYIITILNTDNGCTNTDTVDISVNQAIPTATAGADSTITCIEPSVTLIGTGSSVGPNFTAMWSGPGINAGNQNMYTPVVDVDGTYSLVITNTTNGCTATDTVLVNINIAIPTADAGLDQTITCANPNGTTLNGSGSPANIEYLWSGPGIGANNQNSQNPVVSQQGTYTLQVTDPANGCTSTDQVVVIRDANVPDAEAGPDLVLNCTVLSVDIDASGSATGPSIIYAWTGPGINAGNSADQSPAGLNMPGTYNLVVTDTSNNCVNSDVVVISQNITPPTAEAGPDVILNCYNNGMDTLDATASSSGVNFTGIWSGPGITPANETSKTPVVSDAGVYYVTVTNLNNTCTAVDSVTVTSNLTAPVADAGADQIIDCVTLSTSIGGPSSAGANFSYSWTGPGITPANQDQLMPSVDQPGTYTIVVTDSVNGCTASDDIVINTNAVYPSVDAGLDALLTCAVTDVTLDATPSTGAQFSLLWTGPGITPANETQEDPNVTVPGTYILAVTNTTNSCVTRDTVVVDQNILVPAASAGADGNLDCQVLDIALDGSMSATGATITYLWTGPDISAANETMQNPTITQPGQYSLLVTDTDNGCTATDVVDITQDIAAPVADAGTDMQITCASLSQTIDGSGSSSGPLFEYVWEGNGINTNNFNLQNPMVSDSGTYVVTVTNIQNHCTSTDVVFVDMDKEAPLTNAGPDVTLTCTVTSIQLDGTMSASGPNITFMWSGPGLLPGESTNPMPMVNAAGNYNLTVTNTTNGCTSTDFATVVLDNSTPSADAGNNLTITCANSTTGVDINSSGSSSGPEFTFFWTGPGINASNENVPSPTVLVDGTYTLVVTNSTNGCTATDNMMVLLDQTPPVPDAGLDQTITCSAITVGLDATGSTAPGGSLEYSWDGPGINPNGETSPTPTVADAGLYTVTVTNSFNGCTATDEVEVFLDNMDPVISASADTITCAQPQGNLDVTSSVQGSTYMWEGLGINASNQSLASLMVNIGGVYMVTVTAPNGCTATESVLMEVDDDVPEGTAEGTTLDCFNGGVSQIYGDVISPAGTTFNWTGPGIGTVSTDSATVTQPGTYFFNMVTPAGCTQSISVQVLQNTVVPTITAMPTDDLDCSTTSVGINATGTSTGTQFVYTWTTANGNIVSGANTLNPIVDAAGDYQLFVMNTINGCQDSILVPVMNDPSVPTGFDLTIRDIVCFGDTDGSIEINGINGGTTTFNFTLISSSGTPDNQYTGLSAGDYTLYLLDGNGCELDTTISIGEPGQLVIELGPDVNIELGEEVTVSAEIVHTTPLQSVVWNYSPGCIDSLFGPAQYCEEFTYTPLNSYRHTLTVTDENGCVARDYVYVVVDKPRNVYIPNIFNPNSLDPDNSVVRIYMGNDVLKVHKWMIFDRWGEAVYIAPNEFLKDDSAQNAWDGSFRGDKAMLGVYVYYALIEFIDGEIIEYKGDVTLMR